VNNAERYKPFNRHLLLAKVTEDEKTTKATVLIPDDYKVVEDFGTYRVVSRATDCSPSFRTDCKVVVEETMVRSVKLRGETFYLVPENYVVLFEQVPG
jgi:hypothetical protein